MFVSSVALYLAVRKSSLLKVQQSSNNLAMFVVPTIVFAFLAFYTGQSFLISSRAFLIILGAAIFFSYIGNKASLRSIEYAPNPGYSLVISKSYVVFTALVAVAFFDAELTFRKVFAILLIVGFSALIMLSQKGSKKSVNSIWLPLSFVPFFCWGLLTLTSKYLFNQGVHVLVFLTYIFLIVTICILLEMAIKKVDITSMNKDKGLLLLIGLGSAGFNLFQFLAIQTAPNVGYVNAINASSISAVTIFAIILFKDEFSKQKLVGVLGVTAGLFLLLV